MIRDYREEDDLLTLSLAVVSNPAGDLNRKRKRRVVNDYNKNSGMEGCEGKIFTLLQLRDEMLKKLESYNSHKRNKSGSPDPHQGDNGKGLHLIHLLLITATGLDEGNAGAALDNLIELYRSVSLMGDSVQRVVAYFSDGLAARLLTRSSPFYNMIIKKPTKEEEFLAFTRLYRVSPYYQFAHFTANQAIIEAFEKEETINSRALHVIDFDVFHGFQWPSLIQSLSEKATVENRISLRLTGYGKTLEELQETENRLVGFARPFGNLVFEFQGLLRGSRLVNLRKKKNETVAANLVFHLNTLNEYSKISETLNQVNSLKPSVVILVEQEGNRSPKSFLSRFMESLHYFAAMFDSLDDCLPLESEERLSIEKNLLGKEIKAMLNCEEDAKTCPTYERMETWKGRMEGHGFQGSKLSSKCLMQAKLLLKIRAHYSPLQFEAENGGFRVFERDDGRALSLGWQDRCLLTASAWHCVTYTDI